MRSEGSRMPHLEKSTVPSLRQPGLTAASVAETWQRFLFSDSSGYSMHFIGRSPNPLSFSIFNLKVNGVGEVNFRAHYL